MAGQEREPRWHHSRLPRREGGPSAKRPSGSAPSRACPVLGWANNCFIRETAQKRAPMEGACPAARTDVCLLEASQGASREAFGPRWAAFVALRSLCSFPSLVGDQAMKCGSCGRGSCGAGSSAGPCADLPQCPCAVVAEESACGESRGGAASPQRCCSRLLARHFGKWGAETHRGAARAPVVGCCPGQGSLGLRSPHGGAGRRPAA